MANTALKTNLHRLVDQTENEELLRMAYNLLHLKKESESSAFWQSLTEAQKADLRISYVEGDDDDKLIAWNELLNQY
jgi:hypothetical protein